MARPRLPRLTKDEARKVRYYFVLTDLADELGVSRQTVQRAVRGEGTEISKLLQQKVRYLPHPDKCSPLGLKLLHLFRRLPHTCNTNL